MNTEFFENLLKLTFILITLAMLIFFVNLSNAIAITAPQLQVDLENMTMNVDTLCTACQLLVNGEEVVSGNIPASEIFKVNQGDKIELKQVISLELRTIDTRSITQSYLPLTCKP